MFWFLKTRPVFIALLFGPAALNIYGLLGGTQYGALNLLTKMALSLFMIVVLTIYMFRIRQQQWVPFLCAFAQVVHLILGFAFLYTLLDVRTNGAQVDDGATALYISALAWLNVADPAIFVSGYAQVVSMTERFLGWLYLAVLGAMLVYFLIPSPPGIDREPGFGKLRRAALRAVR